jgi:DNA-binding beta-propeller fold protein YncE
MKVRSAALCGLILIGAALATSAAAQPGAYRLTKTVPLGAPDRWDYVVFDAPSHRVYVAHGDRVSVVDGRDGKVLGEVTGVAGGTHGVAVAAGKGFTDDGKAGEAVVFDLQTFKTGKRIPAADDADGVITEPVTGHVFVMDGDSGKVTVIDPKAEAQIANLDLGGKVEAGVAAGDGRVFVEGAEKREVVVIDARTNRITTRWPIPTCTNPHGAAFDAAGRRLFATCVNGQMVVLNTDTGAVVATVPIGKGTDSAAWDPKRKRAFSSNGFSGDVSVIAQKTADSYAELPTVPTALTARTMAIDPASGRLFVVALDVTPPATPGGRPQPKPGTLRLMFYDPAD